MYQKYTTIKFHEIAQELSCPVNNCNIAVRKYQNSQVNEVGN